MWACGRVCRCGCVLWLPRVTSDVCGTLCCGYWAWLPMGAPQTLAVNLASCCCKLNVVEVLCGLVGVYCGLGVSYGCLGLPLMRWSILCCGYWAWLPLGAPQTFAVNLASCCCMLYVRRCCVGLWACLQVWVCPLVA